MPAVLPEASVVRSPSQAPAAGGRSQAGAEQPASPFSDLLDTCEGTEAGAADVAADCAEGTRTEAAPLPPNAAPPEDAPKTLNAAEATAQAELMLAMVTGLQAAPEGNEMSPLPTADVAVPMPGPDEAHPETEADTAAKAGADTTTGTADTATPPAQADVSDDADILAIAPPVPPPVAVPAPSPVPAPIPATIETVAAPVTVAVAAPVTVAAATAAPAVVEARAVASIGPAGDTAAPEVAQPVVVKNAATIGQATEPAPAPAVRLAQGDKPAAAKTQTNSEVEAFPTAKAPSPDQPAPASKPVTAEAAAKLEKPATRPAEVANGALRDVETPSAKPTAAIAPVSAETPANVGVLTAPSAHIAPAGPQAAHQPAHQPAATGTVPVNGLAVEIAAQARTGTNRFEIRLDPPEFGRIDVRLDVDKDGQVTSHLRVERAETLDLLRRDAPALERALQQAGLKTSENGLQFSLRDQAFSHRDQDRDMPAAARIVVSDDMLVPAETQRNYGRLASLGGGVDIRV